MALARKSYAHGGAAGELVIADPALGVGFAYINNRMGGAEDQRAHRIAAALAECLRVS